LGCNALIFLDFDRPVCVQGYDPTLSTKTFATISGALAYNDPIMGKTLHLVINQAIHIPHLDHHLLCPMQCRVNDVTVNDTPKFLARDPTDKLHALTLENPDHPAQMVTLPLALRGVTLLLNMRAPTLDKWNSDAFWQLHLTSETLAWDPTMTLYKDQEMAMTDYSGNVVRSGALRGQVSSLVINSLSSLTSDYADVPDDNNFYRVLSSMVQILSTESSPNELSLNGHICLRKIAPINPQTLVTWWMISPDRAKHTVVMTTQRGVQTCLNPTLSRHFPTNDRMLCYKQLPHTVFMDTMFAATPSKRGNKMVQVNFTSFGWACAHPMKHKGEAHKTLSLVFHCDGVPPTMVVDDSKEQTLGEFRQKLREADCHHRVTEPYSPWQQATEGCIRELKQGSSRKILRTGSPKPLWDHSLELEALVHSCTSKDIYMTAGQVPETIMTGDTADISHIAEFAWFDWVMFRDNVPA
jgi:hypothetical protein